ncbi:hypothetical protein L1049_001410 [Liquidambar formosana]|uniref:RanBP2-type domain-containing protein n=1 Tax=Liquidambar formosana TaxID=63359 RepID=A0AAP0NBG1_LIQFO
MPRKFNYGVDYDEDYYDYEDYDYDVEENGEAQLETNRGTNRPKLWRCSICTYDNDESMFSCDICGVLRNPLVTTSSDSNKEPVDGICKDSGASIMAKSLFASLPHRTPKNLVIVQQQSDGFATEEGNNFHKLGDSHGHFHEFHKTFSSHGHNHINIGLHVF